MIPYNHTFFFKELRMSKFKNRRLVALIGLGSLIGLFSGCGSSKKLFIAKDYKEIAVVQVSSNKTIEWADKDKENSTGSNIQSTVKFIGALSKGKSLSEASTIANHDARDALNLCYQDILKAIAAGPLPVMDYSKVIEDETYKKLENDRSQTSYNISPEPLKLIGTNVKDRADLCQKMHADALYVVKINFSKDIYTGVGSSGQGKGGADVVVSLIDKTGETLWWKSQFEHSENSTAMIEGSYKTAVMDTLCAQAAVEATKSIIEKLKKDFSKIGQK